MTFQRATFQAPAEISCHGKIAYLTRKAARQAIRRHPDRKGLNAYRCPWCSIPTSDTHSGLDRWHIGHRPYSPPPTPQLKVDS